MTRLQNFKYLNVVVLIVILGVGLFLPFFGLLLIGATFLLQKQNIVSFNKDENILLWMVFVLMTSYYLVNLFYTLKYVPTEEETSAFFLFIIK